MLEGKGAWRQQARMGWLVSGWVGSSTTLESSELGNSFAESAFLGSLQDGKMDKSKGSLCYIGSSWNRRMGTF